MRITFLILAVVVFITSCKSKTTIPKEQKKQPYNVLFISVDDLNDWTGFAGGHPQTQTPNMDKLAQQGHVEMHPVGPLNELTKLGAADV